MRDSEAVAAMRRELGGQLAERRRAAGYVQRELGVLVGYSRTAIANAETGGTALGRQFWEGADRVLRTGEQFARGYDRIRAQAAAESRGRAGRPEGEGGDDHGLGSLTAAGAQRALAERGWPVAEDAGGRLWLVTGTALDALEVPRPAGVVAMSWWLYTRGLPDEIRGLPALPDPAGALAVISAGPRWYFLARSGACPWSRREVGPAGAAGAAGPVVVRWHADGGRVPAPPSPLDEGDRARWAHAPSADGQLVSPMALLHVLAQAAAATGDGAALMLPGGVRAVPAGSPAGPG